MQDLQEVAAEAQAEQENEESITVRDVGPVESLSIPIRPGVVILRGVNDCGKSVTLEAVSKLAGGNGAVTCRDKAAKGEVEGLGVRLSVRQSARRTGELEALSIEGKLSIADLVDPKIKDPLAADRHRIKALLQLTGATAGVDRFREVCSDAEAFERACTPDVLKCDDLVEMAARLKRNLEAASRSAADEATKAEGQALGCKQATEGVDLSIETDQATLQGRLEDAIYEQGELAAKAKAAIAAKERSEAARERLDKEANPPDVNGAERELQDRIDAVEACCNTVEQLKADLARAAADLARAKDSELAAKERLRLEQSHADAVAGWKETIDAAAKIECPTAGQVEAANQAVATAREAIEQAALVREAKAKAAQAQAYIDAARAHRRKADSLREAAKATDDVLSQAVASKSLKVRGGRLITEHPDRGEVFYSDRSDGTRWKYAIDEAIQRIRQLGAERTAIIPVPQDCWGELDPDNKNAIHEYAAKMGVTIITAEAARGELRAEVFDA